MDFHKFREVNFNKFLIIVLISAFSLPNFFGFAQEENLGEICQSDQKIEEQEKILSKEEYLKLLDECQKYYDEEIKKIDEDITKTEKQKGTLRNEIYNLKKKIERLDFQIRQSNITISDLGLQINDTEKSINQTSLKIEDSRQKLADVLQAIYQEDQKSLIEILISEKTLSGFFDNLMALENLNTKSKELLENIKDLKNTLNIQKQSLDEEKTDFERTVKVQRLQKIESERTKEDKEYFSKLTEAQYQKLLEKKEELNKRAREIISRITQLTLAGMTVPQSPKELYELANWAGKNAGGVRPALILGLIEIESALGINVGQCNCSSQPVCRHAELTYKQVMSSKQWAAFEAITKELDLDANTTPVSCYVDGGKVQLGGAMGPAQFMPNTWLYNSYKQKVEELTGIKPANPWRPSDAFLAAALYLANFGANSQQAGDERGAVTAYLCGTKTMTSRCKRAGGEWYVNTVIENAIEWQTRINQGF